ncbi:MAG: NAD-dependent deacylase [Thermoleophilaceae bacterium]
MSPEARASAHEVEHLAHLLSSTERAVVLTGAGVSVPSGVPDFRTPGTGLWANVDPMEVAHIDAWRRDPDRFWRFYGERFATLGGVRPNRAHEVIAELERRGIVRAVITQNVDRLHRRAGSKRVIEVHGSIEWSVCMRCGARYGLEDVLERIAGAGPVAPECDACAEPLKPDVVLFGEMLPEAAIEEAHRLAADADLMICAGSSLAVHPVASLPEVTLLNGGALAVITQSDTPYDRHADVRLGGDVVAELDAVLAALDDGAAPTA